MKGKAVLFGLNYSHCKTGKLKGCINDVYNMAKYIHSNLNLEIELYTDDTDLKNTSYDGIVAKFHEIAIDSYKENLDFVWIHFSGHGSQQKDISGDESDGFDEGLVPSDYEKKGILIDDVIHKIFCSFNPNTKILFICDTCHSGTILDLKYNWGTDKKCTIDNKNNSIKAKTMLISGCQDDQTSADAYNLLNDNKSVGALSASILKILRKKPEKIYNAFSLINSIRNELVRGGFSQYPILSTNYDISESSSLVPMSPPIKNVPTEAPPLQAPVQQPTVIKPVKSIDQPSLPQQYYTYSQQHMTNCQQPVTNSQQSMTNSQQPMTNSQQPMTNSQQPMTNSQQPIANSQQPMTNSQQPIANSQQYYYYPQHYQKPYQLYVQPLVNYIQSPRPQKYYVTDINNVYSC